MSSISDKLLAKVAAAPDLFSGLESLSNSELNSFLLEVFRKRTSALSPAELLRQYRLNRFVTPSEGDPVAQKEMEISALKMAKAYGFETVTLSPLAPLGSCSAFGKVDQNNVVSALRSTEVVSDATNMLALLAADAFDRKGSGVISDFACIHRHVRAQAFDNPNFSSHFSVFCMASGGLDTGSCQFEIAQLNKHITILHTLIKKILDGDLLVRFYWPVDSDHAKDLIRKGITPGNIAIDWDGIYDKHYYTTCRFMLFLRKNGHEINIADGGFVTWSQEMLSNQKHRLLISGAGLSMLERLKVSS